MILVLHGDDIAASRSELNRIKEDAKREGKEIIYIDGKSIQEDIYIQALSSSSLFDQERVMIIEQFLSSKEKRKKNAQKYLELLNEYKNSSEIILWEEKEVSKSIIQSMQKIAQIKQFKLPTVIFQFLDAIRPGNQKHILQLSHIVMKEQSPEFIVAMTQKRVKQLLFILCGKDYQELQRWQKARLTNQAKHFTLKQLLSLYANIRMIEYKRNSGQLVYTPEDELMEVLCTI